MEAKQKEVLDTLGNYKKLGGVSKNMEANQNKAEGFLKQGSILAAASILVRLIGMFYRIPLANIIGDAGNGIYSAAFEVYNIFIDHFLLRNADGSV